MYAKKSLGQHFLKSAQAIDAMLEAGVVDSHDIVLEAGPGKGILTESLLNCAREVIAIEKDPRLVFFLAFKFKPQVESEKLKLIADDVLQFDPARALLQSGGYKVIANIPYYITGQFLRHFLSGPVPPSRMVLLLQKEVAERICGRGGKESILSISVKAYGTPKYIQTVEAASFSPKPKVDSAILSISNISKDAFKRLDEGHFFEVVKRGFSQKRKRLMGNLSVFAASEILHSLFKRLELSENARAEDVSIAKWKMLAQALPPLPKN